jgi:prepilin-type N-terminal cleavage/methylation domain-containing protein
MRSPVLQHQNGMTLVELLVVVSLFTLLLFVVTNGIQQLYIYNAYTFAQAYQVQNARLGLQAFIRDVREMTFADDGTFPLAVMEPHRIGFYSDIDRDDSVEYVEFAYGGTTTLTKSVYSATGTPPVYSTVTPDQVLTLSRYVQNNLQSTSTFFYFDESGNAITNPAALTDVRYISAQIIVNIDPIREPGQFMLRSSAALRNLKENI